MQLKYQITSKKFYKNRFPQFEKVAHTGCFVDFGTKSTEWQNSRGLLGAGHIVESSYYDKAKAVKASELNVGQKFTGQKVKGKTSRTKWP